MAENTRQSNHSRLYRSRSAVGHGGARKPRINFLIRCVLLLAVASRVRLHFPGGEHLKPNSFIRKSTVSRAFCTGGQERVYFAATLAVLLMSREKFPILISFLSSLMCRPWGIRLKKQSTLCFTQKDTQPSQTCSGGHITSNPTQNRCG